MENLTLKQKYVIDDKILALRYEISLHEKRLGDLCTKTLPDYNTAVDAVSIIGDLVNSEAYKDLISFIEEHRGI